MWYNMTVVERGDACVNLYLIIIVEYVFTVWNNGYRYPSYLDDYISSFTYRTW